MKATHVKRLEYCIRDEDGNRIICHFMGGMKKIAAKPGDGLRKYDREKALPGYVLYSPDHSNKFLLIDMEGNIVHEWQVFTSHFGYLLPDGHLLFETLFSPDREWGIVEMDWHGNELWFCPCQTHHDFQRLPNGNTMILCERDICDPRISPGRLLSTYLIEVQPDLEIVWEWYSEDHIEELKELLNIPFPRTGCVPEKPSEEKDWTHTNTVQVLPESPASKDPRFKAGNVILSHRNLSCVVIIDKPTGKVVWGWGPGIIDGQHSTYVLENGHMLCFDNGRRRGDSALLELDLLTEEIVWEYRGSEKEPFYGMNLSNTHRLPNGNTFACSGGAPDSGRLFEVTPEGEIVWEFDNPYAEYAEGVKNVYRAYKYPAEMIEPFLKESK